MIVGLKAFIVFHNRVEQTSNELASNLKIATYVTNLGKEFSKVSKKRVTYMITFLVNRVFLKGWGGGIISTPRDL